MEFLRQHDRFVPVTCATFSFSERMSTRFAFLALRESSTWTYFATLCNSSFDNSCNLPTDKSSASTKACTSNWLAIINLHYKLATIYNKACKLVSQLYTNVVWLIIFLFDFPDRPPICYDPKISKLSVNTNHSKSLNFLRCNKEIKQGHSDIMNKETKWFNNENITHFKYQ